MIATAIIANPHMVEMAIAAAIIATINIREGNRT
jgi:hypothetical protein